MGLSLLGAIATLRRVKALDEWQVSSGSPRDPPHEKEAIYTLAMIAFNLFAGRHYFGQSNGGHAHLQLGPAREDVPAGYTGSEPVLQTAKPHISYHGHKRLP
jgi:hypothetical protein